MMAPTNTKKPSRSWDALTPPLATWILDYLEANGFAQPTPVQAACLPLFRTAKDVVVEAVTGSGKTLAFVIPVLEKLLQKDEPPRRHHVGAVIIAPTRELAGQTMSVVTGLIHFHADSRELLEYVDKDEKRPASTTPVLVPQLVVGGANKVTDDLREFLRLSPTLLIGTPGRLAPLLSSPVVKTPVSSFQVLVLDEADRLLDLGFSQDLSRILQALPKVRRTGLFSASVTDAVRDMIKLGMTYPFKVTCRVRSANTGGIVEEKKTPVALQLKHVVVPGSKKMPALCKMLATLAPRPQRTMVFLSTCFAVKYWHCVLPALLPAAFSLLALHGKMEPAVREKCFAAFLTSTWPTVLITTDLAARGLDIPQVDLVVQVDPPQDTKVFIHRAGRSGRSGRKGLSVVMLTPGREEGYVSLLEVRQTPTTPLTQPDVGVSDQEAAQATALIRARARADRDIYNLAQRAFVSWVRSYSEHRACSIFRVQDLDWPDLAEGFGLLELPTMPELKKVPHVDRSLGLAINTLAIPFKDTVREKKRQAQMAAWREQQQSKKRKTGKANEAWSAKAEKDDTRAARRQKKQRRREAERWASMTDQEKAEQRKLEALIAQVRKKTATGTAAGGAKKCSGMQGQPGKDEVDGFGDGAAR